MSALYHSHKEKKIRLCDYLFNVSGYIDVKYGSYPVLQKALNAVNVDIIVTGAVKTFGCDYVK